MTIRITEHKSTGVVTRDLTNSETSPILQKMFQKDKDIIDNLPSWIITKNAIDSATTMGDFKQIIRKMAKVLYWLAKNSDV